MSGYRERYIRLINSGPDGTLGQLLFWTLWLFSCLYGLVVRTRVMLYRLGLKKSYRATVPVVSIGNLTVGGTGKTPMTDYLVKRFQDKGLQCAIVSRGYGGNFYGKVGRVNGADGTLLMNPESCGDEPYLLACRNPGALVYIARRRTDGVKQAETDGARLVILDDGFQHLAVNRDLNILLLDSKKPFGNENLLPAGILREPIAAIQRSDLIILTRATEAPAVHFPHGVPVLSCRHELSEVLTGPAGKQIRLQDVQDKRCLAFAGIARPRSFFASLRQAGLNKLTEISLADHQEYTSDVLANIQKSCHNHDLLITTEKDAVKLNMTNFPIPCYQIGVDLAFEQSDALDLMIDKLMKAAS